MSTDRTKTTRRLVAIRRRQFDDLIVYRLPRELDLGSLKIETGIGGQIVLTDGGHFVMDMSEGVRREE